MSRGSIVYVHCCVCPNRPFWRHLSLYGKGLSDRHIVHHQADRQTDIQIKKTSGLRGSTTQRVTIQVSILLFAKRNWLLIENTDLKSREGNLWLCLNMPRTLHIALCNCCWSGRIMTQFMTNHRAILLNVDRHNYQMIHHVALTLSAAEKWNK